jgi:hypothetical protein
MTILTSIDSRLTFLIVTILSIESSILGKIDFKQEQHHILWTTSKAVMVKIDCSVLCPCWSAAEKCSFSYKLSVRQLAVLKQKRCNSSAKRWGVSVKPFREGKTGCVARAGVGLVQASELTVAGQRRIFTGLHPGPCQDI